VATEGDMNFIVKDGVLTLEDTPKASKDRQNNNRICLTNTEIYGMISVMTFEQEPVTKMTGIRELSGGARQFPNLANSSCELRIERRLPRESAV